MVMESRDRMKYWSMFSADVLNDIRSTSAGLTQEEAASRLKEYGENAIRKQQKSAPLQLFLAQFKSSIILIMIGATLISAATGDKVNAAIILAIVFASVILSFLQEYSASNAIDELRSTIQIKSTAMRDGKPTDISSTLLVPGDIVLLSAGSLIPADGLILTCDTFHVNQSVLTGEAFAVEKDAKAVPEDADLAGRKNCVFMGTNVHSGNASMLVIQTGEKTEFGQIAEKLEKQAPETEFARGVRHFGYLLTWIMLIITSVIFALNVILQKPFIDSLLFSVAIAIGITPQLLPAIINITLSKGSQLMAKEGVIVRRLASLENFGSIDILCTDKTGTLTEGAVRLSDAMDVMGQVSDEVFQLAYLNAGLQTGMVNEMDEAITSYRTLDIGAYKKVGEIPFDFDRMRLSVIAQAKGETMLIVKGALNSVLGVCNQYFVDSLEHEIDDAALDGIRQRMTDWSSKGFRVICVAKKSVALKEKYTVEDEQAMTLMGFLLFFDPPKSDVAQTVADLAELGITLRVITGDNKLVTMHIADEIGLKFRNVLTGPELAKLDDASRPDVIETTDLFTEVSPNQKEQIILALKQNGHVVGYMGDGINDAPALHAADISISVNTAVDVAKESADFVLREKSMAVLKRGIELGRATFANTMKYINITTSANFGNMFSMAGASLFLPFLPLLPKQILLINFITDFPAMTIASDSVDAEMIKTPRRWDIKAIRNFMLVFGMISSAFDYLSFAVLLFVFKAPEELFQSGWFILSILTELLVLLVMRTRKPFYKSKPAPILLFSSIGVGTLTLLLPYLPMHELLNITPVPPAMLFALLGIAALYIVVTEIAKHFFFRAKPDSKP